MASMLYQHLPSIIGIAGAGQMGSGIAQMCALKGMQVLLCDKEQNILQQGMGIIHRLMEKQVKRGVLTHDDAHAAVGRIQPSVSMDGFKKADFVIEAVTECEDIKKSVFKTLDQVTRVHTILASNTSSISITRLAAVTNKPHRVVGMHFMLPVADTPLVELARGLHTSGASFEAARALAVHLGKQVALSEDRPGFVLYRVLMPMINEAFYCVMEGVGSAEDVDRGLRLGTAMKLGPLRMADAIGLDTCLSIMRVLHHNLGDSKYRPCPLLAQYVDAGWLGCKTGKGVFYYERDSLDDDRLPKDAREQHHPHARPGAGGVGVVLPSNPTGVNPTTASTAATNPTSVTHSSIAATATTPFDEAPTPTVGVVATGAVVSPPVHHGHKHG